MTNKSFGRYASSHQLHLPERFLALADSLKIAVLAFRNLQIVHEGNVRATRGTGLRTGDGLSIRFGTLYPTEAEMHPAFVETTDPIEALRREGKESRPLADLLTMIDDYLGEVIELIVLNRGSTPLSLYPGRQEPPVEPSASPSAS
jgi:hypothetical protein